MINYLKKNYNALSSKSPNLYHLLGYLINFKNKSKYPRTITNLSIILNNYANFATNVSFLQIGSNDGISNDPIFEIIIKNKWKGILVEPIPILFNKLLENYQNSISDLTFENCAVGENSGIMEIFKVNEKYFEEFPQVFFQLASFRKEVITYSLKDFPHAKDAIISTSVPVKTVTEILSDHGFKQVNLIHMDTEGYDYKILKTIDFSRFIPEVILFEHKHLSHATYLDAIQLLKSHSFAIFADSSDTLCVQKIIMKKLPPVKYQLFFWRNQIQFSQEDK